MNKKGKWILFLQSFEQCVHQFCWYYQHKWCTHCSNDCKNKINFPFLFMFIKLLFSVIDKSCKTIDFMWGLSWQINGSVQERRNSSVDTLELHLSCTNPPKWLCVTLKTCWKFVYLTCDLMIMVSGMADGAEQDLDIWSLCSGSKLADIQHRGKSKDMRQDEQAPPKASEMKEYTMEVPWRHKLQSTKILQIIIWTNEQYYVK